MIIIEKKKQARLYEGLEYVIRAINPDDPRQFMHGVNIEAGAREDEVKVIGTDGHRVHIFTADGAGPLVPGFYSVRKTAKEIMLIPVEGVEFCKWERALYGSESAEKIGCTFRADKVTTAAALAAHSLNQAAYWIFKSEIYMDLRYIKDAVNGEGFEIYKHLDEPKMKPVWFKNGPLQAVVMPMKEV